MSHPRILKSLEEAIGRNRSLVKLVIDGRQCKWTDVATYILKGVAKNASLREFELVIPEDIPPPKEVVEEVRRANPKLQFLVDARCESAS